MKNYVFFECSKLQCTDLQQLSKYSNEQRRLFSLDMEFLKLAGNLPMAWHCFLFFSIKHFFLENKLHSFCTKIDAVCLSFQGKI
jgi:hypothetical protein